MTTQELAKKLVEQLVEVHAIDDYTEAIEVALAVVTEFLSELGVGE
jgi:hypothetical protein